MGEIGVYLNRFYDYAKLSRISEDVNREFDERLCVPILRPINGLDRQLRSRMWKDLGLTEKHAIKIASDKDRILRATRRYVYVLIQDGTVVYSSLVESQPIRGSRVQIEASAEAHNALNQGVFSYKLHSIEPVES